MAFRKRGGGKHRRKGFSSFKGGKHKKTMKRNSRFSSRGGVRL